MSRLCSFIPTRDVISLKTIFNYPPIPTRNFDWYAIDDNSFDADYDYESGRYITNCPHGSGATEQEAIDDLFDQMEAQEAQ